VRWLACLLLTLACSDDDAPTTVDAPAEAPARSEAPPRNVVLVIGDGMGPQQVGFLELYARRAPGAEHDGPTAFARMATEGTLGMSLHYPMDRAVADSACSASQIALGLPVPSEAIGVDARGEPAETLLERAQAEGMATGLVSDTRLTHATPAAFAAHVAHRTMENEIAAQMIATAPDLMLSGGRRYFVPQSAEGSRRADERDLLAEAQAGGYTVVSDREALRAAPDGKLLGLFADSGMLDAITERGTREDPERTQPALHEMAEIALDRLSRDPDGFFLLIESGQIDWACHANDAGWLLAEMRRANEMLSAVLAWAEARDDTLVVVTADHETGGFGVSYSSERVPAPRPLPGAAFADRDYAPEWNFGPLETLDHLAAQRSTLLGLLDDFDALPENERDAAHLAGLVSERTDFSIDEEAAGRVLEVRRDRWAEALGARSDFYYANRARAAVLGHELQNAENVVWATGTHTHTPVMVLAHGPGAETFGGLHHHTELGQLLRAQLHSRD